MKDTISFIEHEKEMRMLEDKIRKLTISAILIAAGIVGSNAYWIASFLK